MIYAVDKTSNFVSVMKNFTPLFVALACAFSLGCFAQHSDGDMADAGGPSPSINMDDEMVVVSYHVEERINMKFGSRITTYDVKSLSLVNTTDLGPDNTRVVTPIYGKAKPKPQAESLVPAVASAAFAATEKPMAPVNFVTPPMPPVEKKIDPSKTATTSVKIDLINTYERVLDKGYQSIDLLKKVGNSRFFDGDLVTAAKWYTRLFELTTEVETEIYYRYAQSLKAVKQMDKANEMTAIWEKKRNAGK